MRSWWTSQLAVVSSKPALLEVAGGASHGEPGNTQGGLREGGVGTTGASLVLEGSAWGQGQPSSKAAALQHGEPPGPRERGPAYGTAGAEAPVSTRRWCAVLLERAGERPRQAPLPATSPVPGEKPSVPGKGQMG